MGVYQKAKSFGAPVNECFKALPEVLGQLHIVTESQDEEARKIRAYWTGGARRRFTVEAACVPFDEKTTELTLSFDPAWSPVKSRPISPEGAETVPAAAGMFEIIFYTLSYTLGLPPDTNAITAGALQTFTVFEFQELKNKTEWMAALTENEALFINRETGRPLRVPRDQAREKIVFLRTFTGEFENKIITVSGVCFNLGENNQLLSNWYAPAASNEIRKNLRYWGIAFILMGVVLLLLREFELSVWIWGGALAVIGILDLIVAHRIMYIVNGAVLLITAGLFHSLDGVYVESVYIVGSIGGLQIIWGLWEIWKSKRVKNVKKDDAVPMK